MLNTPVVGEGVETRSQAELLTANGCALAQGYYYGKPAPASEWADLAMTRTRAGADRDDSRGRLASPNRER